MTATGDSGSYVTAWLVPDLRACEVVEGYFAWFTQSCGAGTYRVLNVEGEEHAVCSRHEARILTQAADEARR